MKWVRQSILFLVLYISITVLFIQNFENLLSEIFTLRKSYLVEKSAPTKTIVFSLNDWQNIPNKKEIRLNNIYYDIISVSSSAKKILAEVIEDKNESFMKFITHSLHKKEKK